MADSNKEASGGAANSDEAIDVNSPEVKKMADERKRFLKEQFELRRMAKELDLSLEDYIEAFGDSE